MFDPDEIMRRLHSHKGVLGIVIANADGIPIKTTMDHSTASVYASTISRLAEKGRGTIRDLDPANDLVFICMRTKYYEILVAPDKEYLCIAVQEPLDLPIQEEELETTT